MRVAALWVYLWLREWQGSVLTLATAADGCLGDALTTCRLNCALIPSLLSESARGVWSTAAIYKSVRRVETADGTHRSLVPNLAERLFISNVAFGPAVGDHVAGDGRVVDGQRSFPAHK